MTTIKFTTRDGEDMTGTLVHSYFAYEGGKRYIVESNGRQYRLIRTQAGNYVEYVA